MSTTCIICLDDVPQGLLVELSSHGCRHERCVCRECARSFVEQNVRGKKGAGQTLRCPREGCAGELEGGDVMRLTSPELQAEYDHMLMLHFVRALPEFRWCSRPGCGSGQEHSTGEEQPIMTCHACRHRTCFSCRVAWHAGQTCGEYNRRVGADQDALLRDFLERNTKPCPSCREPIEKVDGCDHMTCRPPGGCRHEFCWLCLAPFQPIAQHGNHMHRDTCQHWRPERDTDPRRDMQGEFFEF